MNLNLLKTSALIALATTLSAFSAFAALSYSTDDLFLGFRQAGNNSTDYAINLGQAAQFRDAQSTFTLSLPGLTADLTAAFGSLSNISWGVVGTTQNTAAAAPDNLTRLLYSSEPVGSIPTASNSQNTQASQIVGFKNYWQTLTASQGSVANSAIGNASDTNSWNTKMTGAFGGPTSLAPIEDLLTNNLDLFRIPQLSTGQQVTNEGYFSFSGGNVTFNVPATPVPEPSTLLFGCALLGALCLNRRRTLVA